MSYLAVGCRVLLGVVLAVAAAGKLRGPAAFTGFVFSVRRMGVLPPALARPAAVVVLAAELSTVVALAVPTRGSGLLGFGSATALLVALTVGVAVSLARGNREPCRCFGPSETPLGRRHLGRNAVLVVVALLGLGSSASGAPTDLGLAALAAVAGAVLAGLVVMLDDLVALAGSGSTAADRSPRPAPVRTPAAGDPAGRSPRSPSTGRNPAPG